MLLEKNETENDWRILKLNLNNEKLWVILEEDSIFYSQIFRDDTSYFKENDRFRVVVKKSVIDSLTKENVFRISKEWIKKPNTGLFQATCYAGDYLNIELTDRVTSISCSYSSTDIEEILKKDKNLNSLFKYTFDVARKGKLVKSKWKNSV